MRLRQRWIERLGKHDTNKKVDEFLLDVIAVCKKHKMSLGHEDGGGCFIVGRCDEFSDEWLMGAYDYTTKKEN